MVLDWGSDPSKINLITLSFICNWKLVLQVVKQHLDRGVLDIIGDRIKFDEWYPIVSALRWDQSLHHVAIRLRHRAKTPLMEADTDLKARNATKQPALTTKFVLYWLLESIRKCLSQVSVNKIYSH